MTFGLIMPLLVLVVANTAYQLVCAKTPAEAPAFLSLAVTYVIATIVAGIAYKRKSYSRSLSAPL